MPGDRELQVFLRLLGKLIEQHLHQAVHCRFSEFCPAALGHDEEVAMHVRATVNTGASREDIAEAKHRVDENEK